MKRDGCGLLMDILINENIAADEQIGKYGNGPQSTSRCFKVVVTDRAFVGSRASSCECRRGRNDLLILAAARMS